MTDWTEIDDPVVRLHGFISGFHATYYVYTGIECGLFESLVDRMTPADVASELGYHQPYVERFCEAGLRWGLLTAEPADDGANGPVDQTKNAEYAFRLREPFVQPLADPDAAQYMGGLFQFAAAHLGEDYLDYPDYFATGETRPFVDRNAAFTDVIEGTTRGLQTIFVEKLVPELLPAFEARLSDGGRILDVGCGTGHLACRLCERYQGVTAVGVDVDSDAVERASERAATSGVDDRTTFRTEDATKVAAESTGEFDAAVLFMSLHEIAADRRNELFRELGDALATDGVVAVFDEVYPDNPSEFDRDPFANGVETQWSELVWGNDVPTADEQRDLLSEAGLTEQSRSSFADRFVTYEGVRNR